MYHPIYWAQVDECPKVSNVCYFTKANLLNLRSEEKNPELSVIIGPPVTRNYYPLANLTNLAHAYRYAQVLAYEHIKLLIQLFCHRIIYVIIEISGINSYMTSQFNFIKHFLTSNTFFALSLLSAISVF